MPCRQVSTFNGTAASSGSYRTEAECNQACREGACCEGTTCSVKPQCQCQGTGKVFKGVGTVCSPNPCCGCLVSIGAKVPASATLSSFNGQVLTQASACNCEIINYPFFMIGVLCTSTGMRVNATFIYGLTSVSRLWSPSIQTAPDVNCGTTVTPTLLYC